MLSSQTIKRALKIVICSVSKSLTNQPIITRYRFKIDKISLL
jgi:hypothetical protein